MILTSILNFLMSKLRKHTQASLQQFQEAFNWCKMWQLSCQLEYASSALSVDSSAQFKVLVFILTMIRMPPSPPPTHQILIQLCMGRKDPSEGTLALRRPFVGTKQMSFSIPELYNLFFWELLLASKPITFPLQPKF